MFKLQRIDISGFKSFVDPVSTDFSEGITAIVGPNGCGKSNLSEAITWVLGEQSAKSLRGGKMEDVIFSGTDRRKPLGMAEVSLTLEVRDPAAHEQLDEGVLQDSKLTIGRRVFRSGESQYRLNDKVVRLKEIKSILADTGLGVRAYSVIEQGKIGQILSGKPQERRRLIEEAAGITHYKTRKRLAELKLEEATGNRNRLDDILSEIESALRKLKRQSNAARRYKEREAEVNELELVVLRGRWGRLCESLDELELELEGSVSADATAGTQVNEAEQRLTEARTQLEELGNQLTADHQKVADLGAKIEGREQFLRGSQRTLEEMGERLRSGTELAAQRERESQAVASGLQAIADQASSLHQERDGVQQLVEAGAQRLAEAEEQLSVAEADLETARSEMMATVARLNASQNKLHKAQIEEEKSSFRLERLDADVATKAQEREAAAKELEEVQQRHDELERRLGDKTKVLADLAHQLEQTLASEKSCNEQLEELRAERSELQQRQKLLKELEEAEQQRREDVRDTFVRLGVSEPRFLDEVIQVPAGWEGALDLYLESLHDVMVIPDDEDALSLARAIAAEGREATLLAPVDQPVDDLKARLLGEDPSNKRRSLLSSLVGVFRRDEAAPTFDASGLVGELGEALQLSPGLANALPAAFLVETAEDAVRFAQRLRGVAFVSRERVWAQDGVVHVQSESARPGVLGRARELEDLDARAPQVQAEIERLDEQLRELVLRRTETAEQQSASQAEETQLRQEKAVAVARRQDARERNERLDRESAEIADRRDALRTELEQLRQRKQELSTQLEQDRGDHGEIEKHFGEQQTRVEQSRELRNQRRSEGGDHRGQLNVLVERVTQQTRERQRLEKQSTEITRFLGQWRDESERLGERSRDLEEQVEAARKELGEASRDRQLAEDQRRLSQSKLDDQRSAVRSQEQALEELRKQREESRSRVGDLRIRQASQQQDAEHLRTEYEERFDDNLPSAAELRAARAEPTPAPATVVDPGAPATDAATATAPATQSADDSGEAAGSAAAVAFRVVGQEPERDGESIAADEEHGDAAEAAAGEEQPAPPSLAELFAVPEDLDERIADLKARRDQLQKMGPVNVLAAEEYAEQEERFTFMSSQREDVQRSIESLRATIAEINATSQERFVSTFETVNVAFGEVFSSLFRGGEASMRLLDEEDPIESGIEIVARPPGKRLQNIQLMSGGEKALTAIALLFALFQTKPSPFCILDEVDAPLDDANVMRFVTTLQEMAKDTQFLVVTHNKLTMESASSLYGVTMAEKGVSKLVGVDIDELHPQSLTA